MALRKILQDNRAGVDKLAKKYGAKCIRFFYSDSFVNIKPDIDIIIELKKGKGLLDHAALIYELSDLLGININAISEKDAKERKLTEIKECSAE